MNTMMPGSNAGMVRILSREKRPFSSRQQAGEELAGVLHEAQGRGAVVLGIPRGGIVVAWELARILGSALDVVLSRKLGAPGNPELAIGAVSEDGEEIVDTALARSIGADEGYIHREKARQLAQISRVRGLYRMARAKERVAGRIAIVVDDGIATGATMQAALLAVRREAPRTLIAALPVCLGQSAERLAPFADAVVCGRLPAYTHAVGEMYLDFPPVTEQEVTDILRRSVSWNT